MSLIWVIIVIVIGVGLVVLFQQNNQRAGRPKPADAKLERTLFTLQPGDIVQSFDTDWLVVGKLRYEDNGYEWLEYLLEDGEDRRWLSVEEEDTVEVALLAQTTQLDVGNQPPPEIRFADTQYKLESSGTASMTRAGATLNRQAQSCRYYDYRGPNRAVLSIEDWDGDMEVTVGERLAPTTLRLLPGSGP